MSPSEPIVTRHLRIGYWALALFVTMGLLLETLHAFKVGAYLDVQNETRRLMWRLAHAHGTTRCRKRETAPCPEFHSP